MWCLALVAAASLLSRVEGSLPPVLGIDLGNEWSKVSAIAPNYNLEMILNTQSKRKTRTVLNFAGAVRTFGENAFAQQTMSPSTVLQQLPSSIGLSSNTTDSEWLNGFSSDFYPMKIQKDKKRGTFEIEVRSEPKSVLSVENIAAHFVSHFQDLTKAHLKGLSWVEDAPDLEAAFVIPVGFTYRQRQLLAQAAHVARVRAVAFVAEPVAAAVTHSLDLVPSTSGAKNNNITDPLEEWYKIMFSVGSRNVQACVVHFHSVPVPRGDATGKPIEKQMPTVDTVACARAAEAEAARGAHQLDILIADAMVKEAEKTLRIKRADIQPRAFRRILKEAGRVKHTLSTNQDVHIFLEGLVQDKDFSMRLSRASFEGLVEASGWLKSIAEVKSQLLPSLEGKTVSSVELLGGGWRAPRVLQEIENVFSPIQIGQKCNSDECPAMGAAVLAANHSAVYKLRPLLVSLRSEKDIRVTLKYRGHGEDEAAEDASFPAGSLLGTSKVVNLTTEHPIRVLAHDENGRILDVTIVNGFDVIQTLREKSDQTVLAQRERYQKEVESVAHVWNPAATTRDERINVTIKIQLNLLGLIKVEKASASWQERSVQEERDVVTTTTTTTTSTSEAKTGAASSVTAAGGEEEAKSSTSPAQPPVKTVFTETIQNRTKALSISPVDVASSVNDLTDAERGNLQYPLPMSSRQFRDARNSLKAFIKADREVEKLNEARNKLETFIYDLRAQLRDDPEVLRVSSPGDREKHLAHLEEDEEWLYDAGFTAKHAAVIKRMDEIKTRVSEIIDRARTLRNRDQLIKSSKAAIHEIQDKLNGLLVQKPWIEAAAHSAFTAKLTEYEKWLSDTIEAQKKLSDTAPTVLNEAAIAAAWSKVTEAYTTLTRIRRPKTKSTTPSPSQTSKAAVEEPAPNSQKPKEEENVTVLPGNKKEEL